MAMARLHSVLSIFSAVGQYLDLMMQWFNKLRCRLSYWLAHCGHPKGLGVGLRIAPDTTSLIRHRRRHASPLPVPKRSHLVYHQQTVDKQAALNSLRSMRGQIPEEDEVLFLDVGATMGPEVLAEFGAHEWLSYSAAKAALPEQQSYTFGMNLGMGMLKGEQLFVWRTDYVYPNDLMSRYLRHMAKAEFACPYDVLVGDSTVTGDFVAGHWDQVQPFDEKLWASKSQRLSLYETQDPALFAISRTLWEEVGGLNHELWGYGWQFAEFAVRVRTHCHPRRVMYFDGAPPLHQTHEGTLMHAEAHNQSKRLQAEDGVRRFSKFLGGSAAYWVYRCKQHLPPHQGKRHSHL
jgi:hypothetical protein